MVHFPFKEVTAGSQRWRSWAADGCGEIPKLFFVVVQELPVPVFTFPTSHRGSSQERLNTSVRILRLSHREAGRQRAFLEEGKLARGNLWNDARATASLPLSKVQLRWLTLASALLSSRKIVWGSISARVSPKSRRQTHRRWSVSTASACLTRL